MANATTLPLQHIDNQDLSVVDARAPRFNQTVVALGASIAVLTGAWLGARTTRPIAGLVALTRMPVAYNSSSMALSRMEATLGHGLFQRMMQGMVATDATARLVMRAKRVFAEIRHMQSDLAAISGSLAGLVTIGTLPLGRTFVVPTGIAHALAQHPGLRVVTFENQYEQLIASLRNGDIDVVFGALRPKDLAQGLVTEPLFSDRIGIVARRGHPLAAYASLSLQDLLSQQWILPRPNAPGRRLVDASFQELGLQAPVPSVETGDLAMLRQLLNCSDMLTAISPHQLMFEIQAGTLAELPVKLGATTRSIGFTLRQMMAWSAVMSMIPNRGDSVTMCTPLPSRAFR